MNFELVPVTNSDFDDFKDLRKLVMHEHVLRQGFRWNEAYHQELFYEPGLLKILLDGERIGYVGLQEKGGIVALDRFAIDPAHQNQGIGTAILKQVLEQPLRDGKIIRIDVLKANPARHLYERFGFALKSEDEHFAYYEKVSFKSA